MECVMRKIAAPGRGRSGVGAWPLRGGAGGGGGGVRRRAGAGGVWWKNRRNNVVMNLKSETQGIGLGFGAKGLTIKVADSPGNAPRAYVVEFGFNKTWVNQQSRAALDQLVRAWKCRYANIWLFGHTDSVGKEDTNLELSDKRAAAVRDYLLGTGIVPTRVMTRAQGEDPQLARTADSVRLRTNPAVVIVVQE